MVLCSGCFDGIHAGHVAYLNAARHVGRGGSVRVAIAPDSYIRDAKGREPYWSQLERACAVEALTIVESAILYPSTLADVVRVYRPAMFVKGAEWRNKLPEDIIRACKEVDCEIAFVDTPGRHVSEARG